MKKGISSTFMKKQWGIFLMLVVALTQNPFWASDEFDSEQEKSTLSFMTHQEVENRLCSGLFPSSKQRVQLALAPAAQEYLTEEFIAIVQRFFQKMNIYEKCYVIRAVMKLPVAHLTTLNNLTTEHAQQLINVLPKERVDFLKKIRNQDSSQWQAEILQIIQNKIS
ncbi:MAG: hypothetical protein ACK4V2_03655 [Pseudomonadota bacterium]|jgi:hypothetical protein